MNYLIGLVIAAVVLYLARVFAGVEARARTEQAEQAEQREQRERIPTPGADFVGERRPSSRWPAEPEAARQGDECWIPPGENVEVHGRAIAGGMVYVGARLAAVVPTRDCEIEPALIDPGHRVADRAGAMGDLDYWPSYAAISTAERAGYLDWLASGRSDPDAPIGFVFLFFYGLERRLLLDVHHVERARAEAPALLAEIRRLLAIYGANRSFAGYATQLVHVTQVLVLGEHRPALPPRQAPRGSELPLDLVLPIGAMVADGEPIAADWALAWYRSGEGAGLRTPAVRCRAEFEDLFASRYAARFGAGLRLRPNKRRLCREIRTASESFAGGRMISSDTIPDVSSLTRPLRLFGEIIANCMDDLDAYSRLLGREPQARGSLSAFAHLPAEIASEHGGAAVAEIRAWSHGVLQAGEPIPAAAVFTRWTCSRPDRMSKREAVEFAQVLGKLGVGVEPDVRFAGRPLAGAGKAVFFELVGETPAAPSREYLAAALLLHLAAAVAAADGTVTEEEERQLEVHLEEVLHLGVAERHRLAAHLRWLLAEQPGMAGLKKRLAGIPAGGRAAIAQFAVSVAGADGQIDPDEVRMLRKVYGLLDLDPEDVYGDIHGLVAGDSRPPADEPVSVKPPGVRPPGHAIPPAGAAQPIALDIERVQRKLAQTREVASLLEEIFADAVDEPVGFESASAGTEQATADSLVAGLDAAHSALLRDLAVQSSWPRHEFDERAEAHGLLPNGAVDCINEAAFDLVGEALLDGEDPVELGEDVLREMLP